MNPRSQAWEWAMLVLLAVSSPLLFGYHFGADDQAIWLPAIKKCLHPELYGLDASFFLAQTHHSLFPELIAWSVRLSHVSLEVNVLAWHVFSLFLILIATRQLAAMTFASMAGRWGAIAAIWVSRLTPVGGTHIGLTDIYLHPRDLALGAILLGLVAALKHRPAALAWIAVAAVLHPTMAIFGCFQIIVLVAEAAGKWRRIAWISGAVALLVGLLVFLPETPRNAAWWSALTARAYVFPLRWPGYVWFYTVAALVGTKLLGRRAERRGLLLAGRIGSRAFFAGAAGLAAATLFTVVPRFALVVPIETARTLQLTFFLAILLGGGLLGEAVLRDKLWRWAAFLAPIATAFVLFSRLAYPASLYVEWPGRSIQNEWVQAFEWIQREAPKGALFAINPAYLSLVGEDHHGFRALTERSVMADAAKDRSVSSLAPELAFQWRMEESALHGWPRFTAEELQGLRGKFRVEWVVVETEHANVDNIRGRFPCPYSNARVMVCKLL